MYNDVYVYIHTWWWWYIYIYTLHYITLHYIALHCITLRYIALCCITLHYTIVQYITLYSLYIYIHITLHYITLHYITLHYLALHYIPIIYIIIYASILQVWVTLDPSDVGVLMAKTQPSVGSLSFLEGTAPLAACRQGSPSRLISGVGFKLRIKVLRFSGMH